MRTTKNRTLAWRIGLGYILVGVLMAVFLFSVLAFSGYHSSQYQKETQDLIIVNDLKNSVEKMNSIVNMTYSFLSKDGLAQYDSIKTQVNKKLELLQETQQTRYVRETEDLRCTVETYEASCDEIISLLRSYIYYRRGNASDAAFQSSYAEFQQNYSYVNNRFQDAYSARLRILQEVESSLQTTWGNIEILLIAFMWLICALTAFWLFHVLGDISRSVASLLQGVDRTRKNVAEADPIVLCSGDEFQQIAESFNAMQCIIQKQLRALEEAATVRERLQKAENENLQIYASLQKNHLDFLQARINPHFLFNTLNMISAQAQIEGADKAAELMETAAAFLRYNLDNISKTVTLKQELMNLEDYLEIQRMRYGKRFQFSVDAAEDCFNQEMPCMVLQPLVENSIQHGIGMMTKDGQVQITVRRQNRKILLSVQDNGVGMTAEQIEQIKNSMLADEAGGKHIGLRNIYSRLCIFYKERVPVEISPLAPGLSIRFSLPYTGETTEEQTHETYNGHCG